MTSGPLNVLTVLARALHTSGIQEEVYASQGRRNLGAKETRLTGVCATCCLLSNPTVSMTPLCSTAAPNCCAGQSKGRYCKRECSISVVVVAGGRCDGNFFPVFEDLNLGGGGVGKGDRLCPYINNCPTGFSEIPTILQAPWLLVADAVR